MQKYKSGLDGVVIKVKGSQLLGGFYKAEGDTLRPTAIFLHGVPGVEKNMDLVYSLREAGWNCLYFHYRGSWGSDGSYNLLEHGEDIQAALNWVNEQPSVDKNQLMLIGSSIGGYNTLIYGASEKRFQYLVSLCPLIDPTVVKLPEEVVSEFASMLHGVTSSQLKTQWSTLIPVTTIVEQLKQRHLLLITGDQDEIFPPKHYADFGKLLGTMTWMRKEEADHQFSTCRPWLRETILSWIKKSR